MSKKTNLFIRIRLHGCLKLRPSIDDSKYRSDVKYDYTAPYQTRVCGQLEEISVIFHALCLREA